MVDRQLLCVKMRYTDTEWAHELAPAGWKVRMAADLTAAHRLLQENRFLVGLLIPGKVGDEAFAELDAFLRAHSSLEWVGAFESGSAVSLFTMAQQNPVRAIWSARPSQSAFGKVVTRCWYVPR